MKDASELIALADDLSFAAENTQGCLYSQRKMLHAAADALRTAANQSASERAGVDALREASQSFIDALASIDGDTPVALRCDDATNIGAAIWDYSQPTVGDLRKLATALATPPAQPAPRKYCERYEKCQEGVGICHCEDESPPDWKQDQAETSRLPRPSEAPSTYGKPDGAVRSVLARALAFYDKLDRPHAPGEAKLLDEMQTALHSPKIAAAETSPGDAEARDNDIGILLSALRMHEEATGETFDDCGGMIAQIEADHKARQPVLIAAAIDRLDVKTEAKSQEPDAVAWIGLTADGDCRIWFRDKTRAEAFERNHNITLTPLYTHPTTKPESPAVSVDEITAAMEPVFSFLDELAANAEPSQRHALNPILIGGSAKLYAEGARSAIAALIAGGR